MASTKYMSLVITVITDEHSWCKYSVMPVVDREETCQYLDSYRPMELTDWCCLLLSTGRPFSHGFLQGELGRSQGRVPPSLPGQPDQEDHLSLLQKDIILS